MRTLFRAGWGAVKLTFWLLLMIACILGCAYNLGARHFDNVIVMAIVGFAAAIMMIKVIGRTVSIP